MRIAFTFRNIDSSVCALVVFEDRYKGATHSKTGALSGRFCGRTGR